ncbi:MAG: YesL family protein [Candidatus Onthomonas sp.]
MFSIDGPLWRGLTFIGDVAVMHFLWLLYSLPLVTIGASTTALYYTAMRRIRTDEGSVTGNFKQSFRENFRQSTIYWLALVAVGALLWLDLNFTSTYGGTVALVMMVACAVFLFPYWMVLLYIFPVQAKFRNTLFDNFKNALLLAIRHFPSTLLLTLIWGCVWLLLAIFPPFTGFLIIAGSGALACVTAPIYIQIFRKYLPGELEDDIERSGGGFFGSFRR